jgi:predicted nuclease of restriction endonuclease-like (RecB) superfamily
MKNDVILYKNTNNIYEDITSIVNQANDVAYKTVNVLLVERNWFLGKRIAEEELKDNRKDNYGKEIINELSKRLTKDFGRGFEKRNLYYFVNFYKAYPDFVQTLSAESNILSWSHYLVLLQVFSKEARDWYEKEAITGTWSVRTLQRNVSSDYYHRMLMSQKKDLVKEEMLEIVKPLQEKKLEFIKNPMILEFLGITENNIFKENDLEKAIIDHLQKFLMELGKGYAFIGRQVRIHTEKEDYYIDLVFFNYMLNCFVLIDLKTKKITHQDVGQMDMYVRMYDERIKEENHNPTLGIVLCDDTDEDIAKYSVLNGNEQLFASKYKLYLPSDDELKAEIENQKTMYYLQHKDGQGVL